MVSKKMITDYTKLRKRAELRAKLGLSSGMLILGEICEKTSEGNSGIRAANAWYRQAAAKGNTQAMWNLGVNYLGNKGIEADFKQAIYWINRAQELGHTDAIWALGKMHLAGKPVELDYHVGFALLEKAATKGHSGACASLSQIFLQGKYGKSANKKLGYRWFVRSLAWHQRLAYRLGMLQIEPRK